MKADNEKIIKFHNSTSQCWEEQGGLAAILHSSELKYHSVLIGRYSSLGNRYKQDARMNAVYD